MKILELLNNIHHKSKNVGMLFRASTGKEFEERIKEILTDDSSYIIVSNSKLGSHINFKSMKNDIQNMNKTDNIIENKHMKDITSNRSVILYQPFGSQQYPDFIVMNNRHILPIEIKYSTLGGDKPTWNSGLPRSSGLYIFGSFLKKDITFFMGDSILSNEERRMLIAIFDSTEDYLKETLLNHKKELPSTFGLYLRRMYNQKKSVFSNVSRTKIEKSTISFVKENDF